MIIVHACAIIIVHVPCPARLVSREIENGGSGGEGTWVSREVSGGRQDSSVQCDNLICFSQEGRPNSRQLVIAMNYTAPHVDTMIIVHASTMIIGHACTMNNSTCFMFCKAHVQRN